MRRPAIAILAAILLSAPPAWAQTGARIASAARGQVGVTTIYDPAYVQLRYPNGDLPMVRGVCADVIVRAFRGIGVDLQAELHNDMARNFAAYPKKWGLRRPDSNIDHRRVPNLRVFFSRHGTALAVTGLVSDYRPGDLVTWDLSAGVPHIGIVVDQKSNESGRYMVVHNIGAGPRMEDVLFHWKITGHYRYFGPGN